MMDEEIKPVEQQTAPVETPSEQPPRHPFYDRIKSMHPDREFASDDDMLSAADEKLTEHEGYRSQNEDANKKIIEALYAEPILAQVLDEVGEGADLAEALALHISPDDLEKALADSDSSKWPEKKAMREANRAAHQSFMDEVNANTAASQAVIEGWSAKRGLNPESTTEYINDLSAALQDIFKGKITEKFLDDMYEARTKAADLEEAATTGEIKGRNANIEELTAKESSPKGDGLPAISSLGAAQAPPKPAAKRHELEDIAEYSQKHTM